MIANAPAAVATIAEAAGLAGLPVDAARRYARRLYPDLPRVGNMRIIPRDRLDEVVAGLKSIPFSPRGQVARAIESQREGIPCAS